jgi:hypothetical protein
MNSLVSRSILLGASWLIALTLTPNAAGQLLTGASAINGAQEVPANASAATGVATYSLDLNTDILSWNVSYSGLVATAAHFHGAAPVGANAGVQVGIGPANPNIGSIALTAGQSQIVQDAQMYLNIHSAAFPGGEIRTQVLLDWPAWTNLGGGTSGALGQPLLHGNGPFSGGSTYTLTLTNAPTMGRFLLRASLAANPVNIVGGTLYCNPPDVQFFLMANAGGSFQMSSGVAPGVPSGVTVFFQCIVQDFSNINNITLSNAMRGTTP